MSRWIAFLTAICALLATAPAARAQENAPSALAKKLLGTWRMVANKYGDAQEFTDLPREKQTILKHFTLAGTAWVEWDPETGKVLNCAGGAWAAKDDQLTEKPAYGMGPKFGAIKGKELPFTATVAGNRWTQSGGLDDLKIEEIWERVPGAESDDKALAGKLAGTWQMAESHYEVPKAFLSEPDLPKEGDVTLKLVTPTHFFWATRNADGQVTRCAGGTWWVKAGKVVEKMEHGQVGGFATVRDQELSYTCTLDGDRWRHATALDGGVKIEETWERAKLDGETK